jgi:uncharacterized protein (UPF0548 family)
MFLRKRPTPTAVETFLAASREASLSYGPVGLAGRGDRAFLLDECQVVVGRGERDFARARTALLRWAQFDVGWAEVFPVRAPVEVGAVVAVLIRHLGFWSLNGARVVYVSDAPHEFAFAYGTLTTHAECGEELFQVAIAPETGDVIYRIRAASRPHALLTWLGYPVARVLQARFRRDSCAAMTRATAR